jgi:hypothetical protein
LSNIDVTNVTIVVEGFHGGGTADSELYPVITVPQCPARLARGPLETG